MWQRFEWVSFDRYSENVKNKYFLFYAIDKDYKNETLSNSHVLQH